MPKAKIDHLKIIKNMLYQGESASHSHDSNQVSHIEANDQIGFAYGLGRVHAEQRGLQVGLIQLILRGQLNEFLGDEQELIDTDEFMEQFAFHYQARREEVRLKEEDKKYLQAYVDGLNEGRRQHFPIEFKFLKIPFIKWTIPDSLALLKLMAFLGLAQTQLDAEKLIAQSLARGVDYNFLRSLFHPQLPEKCPTDLALFPQIKFSQTVIPENFFFQSIPALKNSNNWVTRSSLNANNAPIMAFDPHLEVNRLPAVWFECVWNSFNQYSMGITLPGVPGFIMGRNEKLAFSFTYGFMDTFDYFIETIQDTLIVQEQASAGLNSRNVVKKRKDGTESTSYVFSSDRGILEVPKDCVSSQGHLKDGLYLSRAWSGFESGSAEAIEVLRQMHFCQNVDEAADLAKKIFISANWLFCDSENNIAYQQSGYLPQRPKQSNGLVPLDASEENNYWKNHTSPQMLLSLRNPDSGFICTANNQIEGSLENGSINIPMADYRYRRICEYLKKDHKKQNYQYSKAMQADLYSLQAKDYLEKIKTFIPDTPNGRLLSNWDLCYDESSIGASLFEHFLSLCYKELLSHTLGEKVWLELSSNSQFIADYYGLLDRVLLRPEEQDRVCFKNSSDHDKAVNDLALDHLQECLNRTLSTFPTGTIETWGKLQSFTYSHILLGQKVPNWLPINSGPFPLQGSRATINQGNLFKTKGRVSTFAPSYRFITSMSDNFAFTVLPGGPSDRFWKKSYRSELKLWQAFQYKTLRPRIEPS